MKPFGVQLRRFGYVAAVGGALAGAAAQRKANAALTSRLAATSTATQLADLKAQLEAVSSRQAGLERILKREAERLVDVGKHVHSAESAAVQVRKELLDFRTNQYERRHVSLMKRLDHVDTRIDQTPADSLELARLAQRVAPTDRALPGTGGWALSTATLVGLVERVLVDESIQQVVECGSGTSTVWTASAMRTRGSGHVTALEHDPRFAEETRGWLARHGLQDWATVVDAPLADVELEGAATRWFDPATFDRLPERIDLLLVDGPPGASAPLARRPAYLLLGGRLPVGAQIVLDDTDRAEEQEIAADWLGRVDGATRLVERATVGRSTFFEVVPAG